MTGGSHQFPGVQLHRCLRRRFPGSKHSDMPRTLRHYPARQRPLASIPMAARRCGRVCDRHRSRAAAWCGNVHRPGATRVEGAAGRRLLGVGHLALEHDALTPALWVRAWHRRDQGFGIGMARPRKQVLAAAVSTIRPRYMTADSQLHVLGAPLRSRREIDQMGRSSGRTALAAPSSRSQHRHRTDTSSAETGSSAIAAISSAPSASAPRYRCAQRWPPENSCG